jgi:hypothetical protein
MPGLVVPGGIGELLRAVAAADPVGGPDAQRAAREELRRVEYHRDDPGLVSRLLDWVARRVDSLFRGSPGGDALLILVVVLAAVVIFAVVRAGPPRRVARAARSDDDPLRPVAAADHRRLAADLTAQGRRAEALREWLRATVQAIEERGILTPTPGRTGAATAREAGPLLPVAADQMRAATQAFDEVWFGGRTATAADVESGRAAAQAVVSARVAHPAQASAIGGYAQPW